MENQDPGVNDHDTDFSGEHQIDSLDTPIVPLPSLPSSTQRRRSICLEDRRRIVDAYVARRTVADIADLMQIPRTTVHGIIKRYQEEDRVEVQRRGGPRTKKISVEIGNTIKGWLDEDCSISLAAIKQRLETELGVTVSITTVFRCIEEFCYTLKFTSRIPERRNDVASIGIRAEYASQYIEILPSVGEQNVFFFDEVGFSVAMRTTHGRSERGSRAVQIVPNLRARNISIFAVMRKNGFIIGTREPRLSIRLAWQTN